MSEVKYEQGMTKVWSDGEKIVVKNEAGLRWVKDNVEQLFGMGEWDKIQKVAYIEIDHALDHRTSIRSYECVSGYIPVRIIEDLSSELPEEDKKKAALEALRDS